MFLLYMVGGVALQAWAWHRLTVRLKAGTITKFRGALRYVGWAFLPPLCFVGGFAAMIGIEEWLSVATDPLDVPT